MPHATHSQVQSLHRSHCTDDMYTMAHRRVVRRKDILSSTRHGSSFAARDTEHFLTASLFYLSCVVVVFSRTQNGCQRIQLSTAKTHGRMAHLRNTPPPQVFEPNWIELYRILVKPQNQTLTTRIILRRLGEKKLSYSQSLVHSAYDFGRKHCDAARLGPRRRAIT